jgi:cellulose synthase/poly-beta-1,6-N-acetylglucosamine synthase-like glycosyltransferase
MRERLLAILVALTGYAFAGYPAFLLIMARVRRRPIRRADIEPALSIIVAAHNEASVISRKLDSILEQDYPLELLDIIVASDGSTDATNEMVATYAEQGVRLLDLPRAGKANALNQAASVARHDILVMTDANAMLAPGLFRALVRAFADPEVGGVSANERRDPSTLTSGAGLGERLYWEYDKWLKLAESDIGSMVSASGSLYAIRRELFRPIQDPSATDDFAISTQVIRAGKRLVFEPEAITWEPAVARGELEFNRRVRIVTRGLRSVYGIRELLLPWNGGIYSVQLWSHKVVRRLVGFLVVGITLTNMSLVRRPRYRWLLVPQVVAYACAVAGWRGQGRSWGRKPWFYVPYYFCLSNLATSIGVIQFLRRRRVSVWEPRRDE